MTNNHMSLKKFFQDDFVNWLILGTLLAQVVLIVSLTQRITSLEKLFSAPAPEVVDRIPDEQGHVLSPSNSNAPVTVVEFADFQCPYCASAELIIKQIISQYPDKITFVYRHFPLTAIQPYAIQAAEASECANEQGKFWEMHDLIFTNQRDFEESDFSSDRFFSGLVNEIGINTPEFQSCLSNHTFNDYITRDISDGLKYGVTGTPTFFVNQEKIVGVSTLETAILKAIEDVSD